LFHPIRPPHLLTNAEHVRPLTREGIAQCRAHSGFPSPAWDGHIQLCEQESKMKGLKIATALLFLIGVSAMAADASNVDVGKSWTLTLSHPTRVGATLLPAGDYNVRHLKDGDEHVLAFKSGKKEMARVGCTMEQLKKKTAMTTVIDDKNDAGEHVLVSVAFAGDSFQHDLVRP
jgi:hypothetical protein